VTYCCETKLRTFSQISEVREAVEMQKYVLRFTELDITEPRLRDLMCVSDYNGRKCILAFCRFPWKRWMLLELITKYCLNMYNKLHCLRFFRAFSSVVRQMPGCNPQRRGTARTLLLKIFVFYILFFVLFCVLFVSLVLLYVLFVCKCVLCYCHRVATQLQLTGVSYII